MIMLIIEKGKGTQKYKQILNIIFWKLFDANRMEIGLLVLKISWFYVYKMATNGGRHFEINLKKKKKKIYIYIYIYIYI